MTADLRCLRGPGAAGRSRGGPTPGPAPSARAAVVLALLAPLAWSAPAWGQAAAGYYVTPSLSVAEEYRSNIFEASKSPTSDFVTLFTPGLGLGYRSEPFTLLASYRLTSELYADNSSLDTAVARQVATLELRFRPERRLTLRLDGAYTDTNDASQFLQPFTPAVGTPATGPTAAPAPAGGAPAAGGTGGAAPAPGTPGGASVVPTVTPGRRHGSVISVSAGASYALDQLSTLDGSYGYTRTQLSGSPDDQSHEGSLGASRQLTPLDRGSLRYHLAVFEGTSATPGLTTHAVLVGWTRQLTEPLTASAEIGPRFDSDGGTGVEANASLTYRSPQSSVGLTYRHGEGLVVGRSGPQTVDTVGASATYQPLRELTLALAGGVTRTDSAGSTSGTSTGGGVDTAYSAGASASYQLTASLSLRVYYQFSHEDPSDRATIESHVAGVSLDWAYPIRIE